MDPLDHYSIDEAIVWINNEAGDIHVWMNIIGGFSMGNHVEQGHDDWTYMYNTNFMTALNCCQQILPAMKNGGWGRIINMGSQIANNGMPLAGPYCASKAAVHSLTQTIALENSNGVTCNAVVPGIIDTPKNRQNMPEADHSSWVTLERLAKYIEKILLSKENGLLAEI
jgi:NAD(P)-dependent dehydrogenase (short-subunit alcohol dehydrogenase family)